MTQETDRLLDIEDPAERALAAEALIEDLQRVIARASIIRSGAVAEMQERGTSLQKIAEQLDISKTRVAQLAAGTGREEPGAPSLAHLQSLLEQLTPSIRHEAGHASAAHRVAELAAIDDGRSALAKLLEQWSSVRVTGKGIKRERRDGRLVQIVCAGCGTSRGGPGDSVPGSPCLECGSTELGYIE